MIPNSPSLGILGRRTLMGAAAKLVLAAGMGRFLTAARPAAAGEIESSGALQLGPRTIPLPKTISAEAQKFLSDGAARLNLLMAAGTPAGPESSLPDKEGWRKLIAAVDRAEDPTVDRMLTAPAKVEHSTLAGVGVAIATPNVMRDKDRAWMNIHGGGFAFLGGRYPAGQAAQAAAAGGCTVFSVDYRRPPDFPFPAALDDCVAVYRELLKTYDHRKIIVSGESAGGNLTATMALKLRALNLPLPAAIGMLTPATDLTRASDTLQTNFGIDTVLTTSATPPRADVGAMLYADGHDLRDPYISPLFGDFTKGFPPTFLQSGTRDLLLSDTVRMHRALLKAGIEAELHVWEAMPHSGFGFFTPEDEEIRQQFLKFADKHTA